MIKYLWILLMCAATAQATVKINIPVEISDETYILAAMDAQLRKKYDLAFQYFQYLYQKTGQKEYLYNSLRMYESQKGSAQFTKAMQEALEKNPDDAMLLRFHIVLIVG